MYVCVLDFLCAVLPDNKTHWFIDWLRDLIGVTRSFVLCAWLHCVSFVWLCCQSRTLEQLKKHLSGHVRLRLSISAGELGGKTVRTLLLNVLWDFYSMLHIYLTDRFRYQFCHFLEISVYFLDFLINFWFGCFFSAFCIISSWTGFAFTSYDQQSVC